MVQFGRHQNTLIGISVLQSRLDAWLVGMSQPLTTMADYSIALIVQEQLRKLWGIYSTIRYPVLVKMSYATRKTRIAKEGSVVFLGMTAAGILIIFLSFWLIPLLLPESYARSIQFIPVLIAAVLVGIPGGISEMFFKMNEDSRSQYMMRVCGAVFGIAAPLIFLSKFGAIGVAYGRLIANLLFSVVGIFPATTTIIRSWSGSPSIPAPMSLFNTRIRCVMLAPLSCLSFRSREGESRASLKRLHVRYASSVLCVIMVDIQENTVKYAPGP